MTATTTRNTRPGVGLPCLAALIGRPRRGFHSHWALLDLNQRPLPCERVTPNECQTFRTVDGKNHIQVFGAVAVLVALHKKQTRHLVLIDAEDAPSVAPFKWHIYTNTSGRLYCGNSSVGPMHRFLLNAPAGLVVDHIHHDGLDNRKSEIRVCTVQENSLNRSGPDPRNKTTGLRGIHWHKGRKKWRVQLWRFQKIHDFGLFTDLEAAKAVVAKQLREWGVPC